VLLDLFGRPKAQAPKSSLLVSVTTNRKKQEEIEGDDEKGRRGCKGGGTGRTDVAAWDVAIHCTPKIIFQLMWIAFQKEILVSMGFLLSFLVPLSLYFLPLFPRALPTINRGRVVVTFNGIPLFPLHPRHALVALFDYPHLVIWGELFICQRVYGECTLTGYILVL
jgi:hypothetical protein